MVKFSFVKSKQKVLFLAAEIDFFEQNCVRALETEFKDRVTSLVVFTYEAL